MKRLYITTAIAFSVLLLAPSCKSVDQYGVEQQTPFRGSDYESSRRYFRAVGKGQSADERVARSKSDMDARTQLAGMVDVTIKEVADDYLRESAIVDRSEVMTQFQSLSRQVMNTRLADVRKLDEKVYYNSEKQQYTAFTAYEIHKNSMFDMIEDQIELKAEQNEAVVEAMKEILEQARKQSEE
ncbi:MAG: hypothetical protein EP346_03845 [Bacteroidetes bacterium]|uniref:LPP20 lipoprotein n=1 Tax=Phaeocystidibacter marisrubri TaxID=1577780 RepID=A0A6L3ZJI8_9FLAO|nr:hypothetical protein [Phaeocystidibacter marisrubri]KAB2817728.1 hypothetical protein F8C82_04810 [Phaeocystidibacter marisrubri]TNE30413.1 MAG: hypothetical protein EP346_03845 [Bacteroidota bacterium]GGH73887.1 hypothetical protein GCM10011318_19290 [Phaeocystidibacter marisrubri]